MNNPIAAQARVQAFLCVELRDSIVAETSSLLDARRFNKAVGEDRHPGVWRKAATRHLPSIMPSLDPSQQQRLAAHIHASPKHTYTNCTKVWQSLDTLQLTAAVQSLSQTRDERDLKPKLLLEMLDRYKRVYEDLAPDAQTGAAASFDALHDVLGESLLDEELRPLRRAFLSPTLKLILDADVKVLPEVLLGFDHITDIELCAIGSDVDLSVLTRMPNLRRVTLDFAKGANIALPTLPGVLTTLKLTR